MADSNRLSPSTRPTPCYLNRTGLYNLGQYPKALDDFNHALELDPKIPRYFCIAAWLTITRVITKNAVLI